MKPTARGTLSPRGFHACIRSSRPSTKPIRIRSDSTVSSSDSARACTSDVTVRSS